ncbi:hypothetical protein C4901_15570 [Acidiferrobacter sp. SPIII_3]|nr:hypothetical protein C4901_15570 [Acidiferrobacter sp. SPIII_3]
MDLGLGHAEIRGQAVIAQIAHRVTGAAVIGEELRAGDDRGLGERQRGRGRWRHRGDRGIRRRGQGQKRA